MFARFSRLMYGLLALTLASTAFAQQKLVPERITQEIDEGQRITLAGSVSPLLKKATDLGALSNAQTLNRMVLMLRRSDAQEKDLQQLLAAQQSSGSTAYHQWLTPAQFQQRFSPAAADVAKVTGWLQSHGLTDVSVSHGGQRVEFSGPVSTVESVFGTQMHQFSLNTQTGVEKHIANASAVSIPQALSPVIAGLVSLNDFSSKPLHTKAVAAQRASSAAPDQAKPALTATDGYGGYASYLAPSDLRTIYGANSLPSTLDGTGVSIAVIGRTAIYLSDIESFRTMFSLPQNDPNIIVSGPAPAITPGDVTESSLDLEWAGAIAKNATINFVVASSTDTTDGIVLATAYAVENVVSPILTLSYGNCEQRIGPSGNLFWSEIWEQAAAEGISVFVASGDGGAAACDADEGNSPALYGDSVNGLSSTPYNVAVGGTEFADMSNYFQYWNTNNASDFSSAFGYIPETTWNDSCDPTLPTGQGNCAFNQGYTMAAGGGGGRSSCATGTVDALGNVTCIAGYPKPSWQQGPGVPPDGVRDIPDVALTASGANDPYVICVAASCAFTQTDGQASIDAVLLVGGTSAATPVMASIMALVEQKNGTYLGLPNATLYQLAGEQITGCNSSTRTDPTQSSSCVFNDITSGNNSVPGLPGWGTSTADFTSAAGYDLASGLGSVNIANLVNNWSTVANSATAVTLKTAVTTAKHGTPIALTVAVTSTAGTPTGDFALLTDKYGAGDQYTLATGGAWSGNVSDLPGGTYSLTAHYVGGANFAASTSAATTLTISPESSTATIVVEAFDANGNLAPVTSSLPYGSTIFFKGNVAGVSGQGVATGTVNVLMDGATNLGSATLTADGGYFISSTAVPVGTHAITLQYAGDNSFNPVTSSPATLVMSKGISKTDMAGGNYVLVALVSPSGTLAPTGTVQIFDNGTAVSGQLPIASTGVVSNYFQVNIPYTFTAGTHTVYAIYSGDSNYLPSSLADGSADEEILHIGANGTAPSAVSLSMMTPSSLALGQSATFTVNVTSKGTGTAIPTGYVALNDMATLYSPCSIFLIAGSNAATAACYMNAAGTYTLRAVYNGDSTYASSVSTNTITVTVSKLTVQPTLTASAAYSLPGAQVSLGAAMNSVTVAVGNVVSPTGTMAFTDSVNGAAPVSLGSYAIGQVNGQIFGYSGRFNLPTGTNVISAVYSGDASFSPMSSTSSTIIMGQPDFTISSPTTSLAVAAGTSSSSTLTLTPTLGYTGAVTLVCSGAPVGSTCAVTPSTATFGGALAATVSVATQAPSPSAMLRQSSSNVITVAMTGLTGSALALLVFPAGKRRRWTITLPTVLLSIVTIGMMGCGGASSPKATLLTVTPSNVKVASGTSVTFTAQLNALTSNPTGTITFYDGTTALGSAVNLSNGVAALPISSLAVGSHLISATYSGDANNSASTSTAMTEVVTGTATLTLTATSGALVHVLSLPITLN